MKNRARFPILLFCFILLILSTLSSGFLVQAATEKRQEKTIRVGFPIQEGLTMRDKDGNLSGYSYDYLMEISQYTGWNYEFIFVDGSLNTQLSSMLEMLEKGEIDILGAMQYDESLTDQYTYPGYCYGINYSGLFVPEDSELRESSLYNFKNIRVGIHNKKKNKSEALEQYAQMNNIKIEQVITDSSDEYYRMIEEGKADALMSSNLAMAARKNMVPVAHFSPRPFYFATTKGNSEITRMLDYAISTIDQVNPDFMTQLNNKYFSQTSFQGVLSSEEKKYLETCGTLEVVIYDNKPPFQYKDSETGKLAGITVEILELIAKNTGIKFHYNTVSSYEEYISFIQNNKADIAADALINFQDAKNIDSLLTLPWYDLPISILFPEKQDFNENGRAAIPYFLKNVVKANEQAKYYDSVEACLQAVQKGEADYCYIGDLCSQYFSYNHKYNDLKKLANSKVSDQKLSFGICDNDNLNLLMIFNREISKISPDTINEIVYRNTYQQKEQTLLTYLEENRNFLIASIMSMITVLVIIFFYIKDRQRKRIAFENKRYDALSSLANEYFYEYNLLEDNLSLSEKCANYFGCEQSIPSFSKRLAELSREDLTGIWQIGNYIINNAKGSTELLCEMPDHTKQWFKIFSSNIQNKKKQTHAVGKITNIQESKIEQIRLAEQASIDSLTGIYNIAAVKDKIMDCLKQLGPDSRCAFLILDIDNFKNINDTFGHQSGDEILIEASKLMVNAFPGDLTGRLGGDEFIVFVNNTTQSEIEKRCQRLCEGMTDKTRELLGTAFSWSIGITWAIEGKSYETLYEEADIALYKTKNQSKNGFSFY